MPNLPGYASRETSIFYGGWLIVLAASMAAMVNGGLRATFGLLVEPIEQIINEDRAVVASIASLNLLLIGLLQPALGYMVDRYGGRALLTWGMLLAAAGTVGTALATQLWQFYLFFGVVMSIGIAMATPVCVSAAVSPWFEKKRGLALGLANSGFSLGQFLFVPIAASLILTLGFAVGYSLLGLMIAVAIFTAVAWLLRNEGARRTEHEAELQASSAVGEADISLSAGMKTSPFWLLTFGMFVCGYTSAGVVITHLLPHCTASGISVVAATTALSIIGIANFSGVLLTGYTSDYLGRKLPLALLYLIRGGSLFWFMYVSTGPALIAAAIVYGATHSATMSSTSALIADYYGRRTVGRYYGIMLLGHQIGAALGAYLGGVNFVHALNYNATFASAGVLAILAGALTFLLIRTNKEILSPAERILSTRNIA